MIANRTINKSFIILKMICRSAAIEHGWGSAYDPFFGFKKLPEEDSYEQIFPFSLEEQEGLIGQLSDHWKPYFRFAFRSGLRVGEQIALKPEDIDWKKGLLHIRRAMTRDENGKKIEGRTKNRYSRKTIKLIPAMLEALEEQKKIYDQFGGEYFFCTTTGVQTDVNNLRDRIWTPALNRTGAGLSGNEANEAYVCDCSSELWRKPFVDRQGHGTQKHGNDHQSVWQAH